MCLSGVRAWCVSGVVCVCVCLRVWMCEILNGKHGVVTKAN